MTQNTPSASPCSAWVRMVGYIKILRRRVFLGAFSAPSVQRKDAKPQQDGGGFAGKVARESKKADRLVVLVRRRSSPPQCRK